jgi:hypothetical protein
MASGRPRKRTATLGYRKWALLHEVFGSSLHAFRALNAIDRCSYAVFRRVWDGKEETPLVIRGVEEIFAIWAEGMVERVKSAA